MNKNLNNDSIDEREFELINIIGGNITLSQRELSHQMNLSLGLVNMLVRRLITKGYIRIKGLNRRKVEYVLTPKGFAEKMHKSVRYTMKTIRSIGTIRSRLKMLISALYMKGERNFCIIGESDLTVLLDYVLREICTSGYQVHNCKKGVCEVNKESIVLICTEDVDKEFPDLEKTKCINVVEELARNHIVDRVTERYSQALTKSVNKIVTV